MSGKWILFGFICQAPSWRKKITLLPLYITHISNWMSVYKNEENIQSVFCSVYIIIINILYLLPYARKLLQNWWTGACDLTMMRSSLTVQWGKRKNKHTSVMYKQNVLVSLDDPYFYIFNFNMWACVLRFISDLNFLLI